jgi:NAD(P)-dependent dehydrogenase (short-subunit alcohol dehydrogenase family)
MNNLFSLEGKTVLVTGASSGIGRQCAVDCAAAGARVVLVGRNQERLEETLAQMEPHGHVSYSFDLNRLNEIQQLAEQVTEEVGALDGLVHAAGVECTKPFKLLTPEDYESILRVNAISGLELARQCTVKKRFNKSGGVIFIASITANIARPGLTAYSASKGALVSAARVMAVELAKRNIRVNTISPGTILTPLMQNYLGSLDEDQRTKRVNGFPLGLGETTDISHAVIFLLSEASRWITGQNLVIDGGYTIQ